MWLSALAYCWNDSGGGGEVEWFWQFLSWSVIVFPSWEQRQFCGFYFALDLSCAAISNMELCPWQACMPVACKRKRNSQLLHRHRLHQLPVLRPAQSRWVPGGVNPSSLSLI